MYRDDDLAINDNPVQLSAIVKDIYDIVNRLYDMMPSCKEALRIKVSMFKASFEKRLFQGIFLKTAELRSSGGSDDQLPNPRKLTIPKTFINPQANVSCFIKLVT